jgi:hypothetical protein
MQLAFSTHGAISRQGFKHFLMKHDSLLGQSPSVEQPGSSISGSGTVD